MYVYSFDMMISYIFERKLTINDYVVKPLTYCAYRVRDTVEYDLYLRNTAAAAASKRQNHESLAKIANPVWKNGEADESDENDDSENDDNGDEDDEAYVGCSRFY